MHQTEEHVFVVVAVTLRLAVEWGHCLIQDQTQVGATTQLAQATHFRKCSRPRSGHGNTFTLKISNRELKDMLVLIN